MDRALLIQGEVPHYRVAFFNELAKLNIQLKVFSSKPPEQKSKCRFEFEVYPVFSFLGFHIQLFNPFKIRHYDVIIISLDVKWIMNLLVLMLYHNSKRIVVWGHGYGKNKWLNKVRTYMIKKSSAVLLYTDRDLSLIEKIKSSERIFITNNTIANAHAEFDPTVRRNKFIFVGRIQKRKDIECLIHAFAMIIDKIPEDINIEIVGPEIEKTDIKSTIVGHKLEKRVRLLGPIHDEEVLKSIFKESLAYVSPGHVGLGVIHALSYGVPVITRKHESHAPEFGYLEDQKNAVIYQGSEKDLSLVLLSFIEDNQLSFDLGKYGFEVTYPLSSVNTMVTIFSKAFTIPRL